VGPDVFRQVFGEIRFGFRKVIDHRKIVPQEASYILEEKIEGASSTSTPKRPSPERPRPEKQSRIFYFAQGDSGGPLLASADNGKTFLQVAAVGNTNCEPFGNKFCIFLYPFLKYKK
jgi:hypothetical protein